MRQPPFFTPGEFSPTKAIRTKAFTVETGLGRCHIVLTKDAEAQWIWLVKFLDTHIHPHYVTTRLRQEGGMVTKQDAIDLAHYFARRHLTAELRASGKIDEATDKALLEGVAQLLDAKVEPRSGGDGGEGCGPA